jgi:hypothetical protein
MTPQELPRAAPCTICGIDQDEIEAGRFAEAVAAAELVITLDLPVSSPLPEAWRRWCAENNKPHRVREEVAPREWTPRTWGGD